MLEKFSFFCILYKCPFKKENTEFFLLLFMNEAQSSFSPLAKEALSKIQSWCALQERAEEETFRKLLSWELERPLIDRLLKSLREDRFLDEQRFAIQYTLGKFRQKKWGRLKIRQGLRLKKVDEKLIRIAMAELDEEIYLQTLAELANKKNLTLREPDVFKRKNKLLTYLLSKGYEKELIFDFLNSNHLS